MAVGRASEWGDRQILNTSNRVKHKIEWGAERGNKLISYIGWNGSRVAGLNQYA